MTLYLWFRSWKPLQFFWLKMAQQVRNGQATMEGLICRQHYTWGTCVSHAGHPRNQINASMAMPQLQTEIMGFRHYSGILLPSSLYASVLQLAVYLYSLHLTKQSLSQQNKINWPLRCAILLVHDCLL